MRFIIGLAAATLAAATAPAAEFALSGENTRIEFVGTKPDGKHTGGFKKVTGTASPEKIDLTIDMDSLYSDDAKLTAHLKNADFFDVKTNPTSKFTTTKIEKTATGATITGDLTINGKTKSISFPATLAATDDSFKLDAEFKIDRTAFGMEYGKGKISDDVQLKVSVTAKK
jgi:polyisoprenoid-binding protein YceI